jgi:pimeloyl-ACP methyl ester carboxylesterase
MGMFSPEPTRNSDSHQKHARLHMKLSNIIFVHGAWANSSAWNKVLPLVAALELDVTSVQLPLTSLTADAQALRRAVALTTGPSLLVGHSYGGAVITEAGCDERIAALLYVAGFAPDAGESAAGLGAGGPPTKLPSELTSDSEGFLKLTRQGVARAFAQDLSEEEQKLVFATQGPISAAALSGPVTSPAWKRKPSWYLRTIQDQAIHPELQHMMAERMQAAQTDVSSSHVAMLSQPQAVADLIIKIVKRAV